LTACVNLFYVGEKCIERQGDYVEKSVRQCVAKVLYFTSYFRLFKYMVFFPRYFTVCITYQPPLVILLSHGLSGYVIAPRRYIYTYIACLVRYINFDKGITTK
jgi:hypothetical protein